jgi:hypothetical protein
MDQANSMTSFAQGATEDLRHAGGAGLVRRG